MVAMAANGDEVIYQDAFGKRCVTHASWQRWLTSRSTPFPKSFMMRCMTGRPTIIAFSCDCTPDDTMLWLPPWIRSIDKSTRPFPG